MLRIQLSASLMHSQTLNRQIKVAVCSSYLKIFFSDMHFVVDARLHSTLCSAGGCVVALLETKSFSDHFRNPPARLGDTEFYPQGRTSEKGRFEAATTKSRIYLLLPQKPKLPLSLPCTQLCVDYNTVTSACTCSLQ